MSDEPWRRLHPWSVLVNLVPRLWASARMLWPLLLAWVWGRATGTAAFDLFLVGAFLVPAVAGTVLHWATLRYRIHGDQLEIDSGWVSRTHRSIGRDRIQNVEVVRNVFHRLAGLAEVRVETASGTEVEGLLSALSVADAEDLAAALRPLPVAGPTAVGAAPARPTAEVLAQPTWIELLWSGLTGLRLATVSVGGWLALQLLSERAGPGARPDHLAAGAAWWHPLGLAALVGTGAVWVSIGTTFLQHAGFRLEARGDRLVVEEGLLTRRRTELPRDRLQLVVFEQGWLRRRLGFGTLALETAAARPDGDGTARASARVPWLDDAAAPALIRRLFPAVEPAELVLVPPHPSAGWRAALPRTVLAALGAAAATLALGPWGAVTLAAVPWVAGTAWLGAARQGWAVTDAVLVTRSGWWSRRTALVPRPKIQSVATLTTPWLARAGLARVSVRLAGQALVLPLMTAAEATALRTRLSTVPR